MNRVDLILLLSIALLFVQCREEVNEVELTIEGQVVSSTSQTPVQGAQVQLSEQTVQGGVVSSAYNDLAETVTPQNGSFSFTFLRKNTIEYLVEVEHPDFFSRDININPDDLNPDSPYNTSIQLDPRAWLQVSLFNAAPESPEDQINYSNLNANFPCACCTNQQITMTGQFVDTTFTCQLIGDRVIYYDFQIEKLSFDSSQVDSVFCPAFDTTQVTINY